MKKVLLATLIALGAVAYMVAPSPATNTVSEQSQSATAKAEAHCTATAYGTCTAWSEVSVTQEQRQKILAAQVGGKYHRPVDTAIDASTAAFIIAAAFLGLGASVALHKIK
jgi:Spy/CpxP family protein refolding chaperone